jgi:homoserine O-acetyltransferase
MTCDYTVEAVCAAETGGLLPDTQILKIGAFQLELGGILQDVTVAYETRGQLDANRGNVVLVTHALTGDSHVAKVESGDPVKGWWDGLVGPGAGLDTREYFVICSNVLGGCRGTTGPSSSNPVTGHPYGSAFPVITVKDMVHLQKILMDHLQIRRLACVIGGSLGGMQALQWAVSYPTAVEKAIVIASPGRTSPQSIAYNEVQRQAVMADPNWRGGDYYGYEPPLRGLAIARMLGMITYHSPASMERKFGRKARRLPGEPDVRFEVEDYLHYHGEKLTMRFDPNSYVCLTRAMDLFDAGSGYPSYRHALERIHASVLVVGIRSDILYPTFQQRELARDLRVAGVRAAYRELDSPWGHDAFLIETWVLGAVIQEFLRAPVQRQL